MVTNDVPTPLHHITVIQYYRDGSPWDSEEILKPKWSDVEEAVRRMDNYCFPIVQLNLTKFDDDDDTFNVIGGDGRWALFHMTGDWQYENPAAGDDDVRLWDSDQGYFCKTRNILTDVAEVLRIVRVFYETGSYANVRAACSAPPTSS